MQVFCLKGDFESLEELLPGLFAAGSKGLEERAGEVWAYFGRSVDLPLCGRWETLEEIDWVARWKRGLEPVQAGPFVVLAPWRRWTGPGRIIVLEPGMAFGTGHHQTTRMALGALGAWVTPGVRLLDLGTGSGILAIAAAMLGADALGVDTDAEVIPQARATARANQVTVRFMEGSLAQAGSGYQLMVANLHAELHQALAAEYAGALAAGGRVLLTGILQGRSGQVQAAMEAVGFQPALFLEEGGWVLQGYRR